MFYLVCFGLSVAIFENQTNQPATNIAGWLESGQLQLVPQGMANRCAAVCFSLEAPNACLRLASSPQADHSVSAYKASGMVSKPSTVEIVTSAVISSGLVL